jgi:hypothetical protein
MSTVAVPLALGAVGVILIVVVVLVLAALAYGLITRGNPRQVEVDTEREEVAEQVGLREPIDFESDLRPPRDP